VEKLSKIILAQDAEMWLISLDKHHMDEFVSLQKQMEANLQYLTVVKEVVLKAKGSKVNKIDGQTHKALQRTLLGYHAK
jgi:hypothetical protein